MFKQRMSDINPSDMNPSDMSDMNLSFQMLLQRMFLAAFLTVSVSDQTCCLDAVMHLPTRQF